MMVAVQGRKEGENKRENKSGGWGDWGSILNYFLFDQEAS